MRPAAVHVEADDVSASRLRSALASIDVPHVAWTDDALVIDRHPGGVSGLRALGRRVRAHAVACVGTERVWVGIAAPQEPRAARRAGHREAREAVALGRRIFPEPRVVLYDDVLLAAAITCDDRIRDRIAAVIEPLERHDRRGKPILVATVDAFLATDLSMTRAAERLGIHRHTLVYRIQLAERLLGLSVRTAPDRLLVEAALLARRLQPAAP